MTSMGQILFSGVFQSITLVTPDEGSETDAIPAPFRLNVMKKFLQGARNASPYLLLALLLPGGSLIALVLWIFRHNHRV
jgi:hypothetical protein